MPRLIAAPAQIQQLRRAVSNVPQHPSNWLGGQTMAPKDPDREPLLPLEADEETPLDLYTPAHGNILAMIAEGSKHVASDEAKVHSEPITDDHAVAASLPVEHSAIDETGHMDHHRKPIISIHGKDVDEHELDRKDAA